MIKLAYNKENRNLVYTIDNVVRHAIGDNAGIVEYYKGTLIDTSTTPDTKTTGFEVQVMGFESKWVDLPIGVSGTGSINNQDKNATPAVTAQTITPDTGYTGLNKVVIAATPLEETNVTPATTAVEVVATGAGKIGLSKVTVAAVTAAIDANIKAENIKKDVVILGVTGTYEGE